MMKKPPLKNKGTTLQKLESHSSKQTIQLGRAFAKKLKPGTVIALSGDLGSGKTTFIKGIALGLGLKNPDEVKSPTFALMHIYPTRIPLYHFDLYRLESLKEIQNIGFEEYTTDPSVITCVEWAEKANALLPSSAIRVVFETSSLDVRRVSILIP